jgi:hypothetical protein
MVSYSIALSVAVMKASICSHSSLSASSALEVSASGRKASVHYSRLED